MRRVGFVVILLVSVLLTALVVSEAQAGKVWRVGILSFASPTAPASEPVGAGLVASLSHPGGNLTGLRGQRLCTECREGYDVVMPRHESLLPQGRRRGRDRRKLNAPATAAIRPGPG